MLNLPSLITAVIISTLSLAAISCSGANIKAPTPHAKAIDQNTVNPNGCGISSLINSYRFGSSKWQTAIRKINGNTDQEQFAFLANNYGSVKSKYTPGTNRWENSSGISALDLRDLANDFQAKQNLPLPALNLTTHYLKGNQSYTALLQQTHQQLRTGFSTGFPPILSIKHLTRKKIEGHIVILYQMPSSIPPNATSFPMKYIDPLGGEIKSGSIRVPSHARSGKLPRTLTMHLPESDIAKLTGSTGDNIVLSSSIAP